MVLLNKLAENNGIMYQKLMKFDRSHSQPHWLTDLTLIDIDILRCIDSTLSVTWQKCEAIRPAFVAEILTKHCRYLLKSDSYSSEHTTTQAKCSVTTLLIWRRCFVKLAIYTPQTIHH